jgi:hypothetical protein
MQLTHSLQAIGAYQVKNCFQAFAFECNLHRYAELQKQMNLVAQLQEQIEEQRAIGLTLEDDVEVLRRRVLEHERGGAVQIEYA